LHPVAAWFAHFLATFVLCETSCRHGSKSHLPERPFRKIVGFIASNSSNPLFEASDELATGKSDAQSQARNRKQRIETETRASRASFKENDHVS
jgi:hypothetical protein